MIYPKVPEYREIDQSTVWKGRSEIRYERMVLRFLSININLYIGFKSNSKLKDIKTRISNQYKIWPKRIPIINLRNSRAQASSEKSCIMEQS